MPTGKCYTAVVAPTGFQQDETGQLGFTFQPVRKVWTVRDLVGTVRTALEREYTDVWVEGEISNFRPAESGHLYFTLKDDAAQVRIVMFRSQARLLRFRPDNGFDQPLRDTVLERRLADLRRELRGPGVRNTEPPRLRPRHSAQPLVAGIVRRVGEVNSSVRRDQAIRGRACRNGRRQDEAEGDACQAMLGHTFILGSPPVACQDA